jgi:hypothetical protein
MSRSTSYALLLMAGIMLSSLQFAAQVGVSPTGSVPDNSAALDIDFNNRGFLPPRLTSTQRDNIANPAVGLMIYNLDTNCYNYFNGSNWLEWCGTCTPQPSVSAAGPDQLNVPGSSTALAANVPVNGTGSWSIISGVGGNVSNPNSPTSAFNGITDSSYTLRWTITTSCGTSVDELTVSFVCVPQPSVSAAGSDQLNVPGTSTTLAANNPVNGTGAWSIISGSGGNIGSPSSASSSFTGTAGNSYVLQWTITTVCGSTQDQVTISFAAPGANYPNGNAAYWTEKNLGFNDVTIGGGGTVYTWDASTNVYKNGTTILVPDLVSSPNGNTVNANTFFGYGLGGSMNGTQFNYDNTPLPPGNRGVNYSAVYDRTKMFVSPLSSGSMSYCKAMQNSHASTCTNAAGSYTINSPVAYSAGPGGGTYTIHQFDGKFDAGKVDNGSDNEKIHQQSQESGSYCNATYGKGWRVPTKMEFGMLIDGAQGTPEVVYKDGGGYKSMWTSNYWPTSLPYNKQVAYTNTYDFNTNNPDTPNYVRCVFSVE